MNRLLLLSLWIIGGSLGLYSQEWQRAEEPRSWTFPRDHGAHPEFKTEWWYFTGNLESDHGRPFGYQLTIFRQGIVHEPVQKKSQWALRDFYFGHFTLSDLQKNHFRFFEKMSRQALGLCGASTLGMNVWLEDWKVESGPNESYHLVAGAEGHRIALNLVPQKPLVLEGDRGLSQKTEARGNASYYYSYPRLQTTGTLTIGADNYSLKGYSWFDHEFSTSSLGSQQVGWDWFSLQLDNGEELMLYLMRNQDGSIDPVSRGAWIAADGSKSDLSLNEFKVSVLTYWVSPVTHAHYPSSWQITLPKRGCVLRVTPRMADQELRLNQLSEFAYWEGACEISGVMGKKSIGGKGYVELTGYERSLQATDGLH